MILGIDLGTCNSVVGCYRNGNVCIIPNEKGSYITKSRVLIDDNKLIVSDDYRPDLKEIIEVKRLLGKTFDEIDCNNGMISRGPHNEILIDGKFTPIEVSAEILKYLKKNAQIFLDEPIVDVIITVPAYFNDSQRSATNKAAELAGLNVVRLLNEPTSASLLYKKTDNETILVFDLGGGTFDVSVIRITDDIFEVLATAGSTSLGSINFDNALMSYCNDYIETHIKKQIKIKNLKKLCENAKIELSTKLNTTIDIESLDLSIDISRSLFENLNKHYFNECMEHVYTVIRESKINRSELNSIILIGPSTKIPYIKTMLQTICENVCSDMDPDLSVCKGACIQGAILSGQLISDKILLDITPLNLGIELSDGLFDILIKKNSSIPIKVAKVFTTEKDFQIGMNIKVYEGLRPLAKDNHYLGSIEITNLIGQKSNVEITFNIDSNGILTVSAKDLTNESNVVSIKLFGHGNIDQIVEDAKKFEESDFIIISNKKAHDELEKYCLDLLEEFKEPSSIDIINETLKWTRENPNLTKDEYEVKQNILYVKLKK